MMFCQGFISLGEELKINKGFIFLVCASIKNVNIKYNAHVMNME